MNFQQARFNMVEQQIRPWDVLDFDLLDVLEDIPRERFVADAFKGLAYADMALPLPNGGMMLEPKIVARLVQGLALQKSDRVLEIGTGSGYATAVLAKLAGSVVTVDADPVQSAAAKAVLSDLGIGNVLYEIRDGLSAASEAAPFDAVYVGGGLPEVPEILKNQLKDGGRMVVVAGGSPVQRALLLTRTGGTFGEKVLFDTVVPLLDSGVSKPFGGFDF